MSYREGKFSASRKRPKNMSLPALILVDVLLVGVVLVVFAFFHHVLPAIRNELEQRQSVQMVTEAPATVPAGTDAPETQPPAAATEPEETEAPTEATEPPVDNRTEWQIKFADHFTDQVVVTENSYSSPNVSVTIETISEGEGNDKVTYHVADIYIGSPECFTTYTADNEMRYFGTQDVMEMDEAAQAVLSISGDFLTYQKSGFLMRNGEIYVSDSNANSLCVLFGDGSMETYDGKGYDIDDLITRGAVQVWSFGPNLLDENGQVRDSYKVSTAVSYTNPRSAIGYYEPGHYCFVVVDGRQKGYSNGMTIPELAAVFQELGCTSAYNLDGGGSAVMVFNHERYSQQSNGGDRSLGDILVIREPAGEEEDGQ